MRWADMRPEASKAAVDLGWHRACINVVVQRV
jgi:hypothetical protein